MTSPCKPNVITTAPRSTHHPPFHPRQRPERPRTTPAPPNSDQSGIRHPDSRPERPLHPPQHPHMCPHPHLCSVPHPRPCPDCISHRASCAALPPPPSLDLAISRSTSLSLTRPLSVPYQLPVFYLKQRSKTTNTNTRYTFGLDQYQASTYHLAAGLTCLHGCSASAPYSRPQASCTLHIFTDGQHQL